MERVNFAKGLAWKISDNTRDDLVNHVIDIYNNNNPRNSSYFPGPQPKSIERKDMFKLFENDYYVCEKSDGVRYLFVSMEWKKRNLCFLMNRKNEIFIIKLNLHINNYKNSILDCELLNDNGVLKVFDAIVVNGTPLQHMKLSERLNWIDRITTTYNKSDTDPFLISKKNMVKYDPTTFEDYTKSIENLGSKTDGYIFTPENDPIQSSTHENMYKFKNGIDNSVDFMILNKKIFIGDRILRNNFLIPNDLPLKDDEKTIVECIYVHEKNNNIYWKPILIRNDKNHSNSFFCYKKTLVNIRENIQLKEFYKS